MPKTHYLQTSFVAGVLDPRLSARTDIRQYYQGMSIGENVVPVPLGGAKRRPGLKYVGSLPYMHVALQAAATATAANGGTANNARDDDLDTVLTTTTNISTVNPYVVVHYDLGSALSITSWDVVDISLTSGESVQFQVQSSTDDALWSSNGALPIVDTSVRSYRVRSSTPISARYWRVVRIGATDLGTAKAELGDFLLWAENTSISAVRMMPFAVSTDEAYIVTLTDRSIQVFDAEGDSLDSNLPSPFGTADLAYVDFAQSASAMVLVHEDYEPRALVRDQVNGTWSIERINFSNIPDFDFADGDSPSFTDDIQVITFATFVEGNTFQLELGGARSGPITYQGTASADNISATEENIRRAVQQLYTVGLSGVFVDYDASSGVWVITLSEDSADNHPLIVGTPLTAASGAAIVAEKIQDGTPRREAVWSATRGWPRTVTFHEGRLWFGGSRALPQSAFGSVVNDFFNFDTGAALDDDAVFITLNSAQLNKINALFSGRDLQLFTSGGEFRFLVSPITPANAAPKNQTQYGAAQIKPVSTDGSTVFVQKTRKVLRDFLFRYEEDAYSSVPISALSAHLLAGVTDIASWQGDGDDDANLVMLVNADGTLAVHVTLRSQEIAAWTAWSTTGTIKAVCVAESSRYVAVLRSINGADVLYAERFDEDHRLDASRVGTFNPPGQSTVTSIAHLNGEDCRARAGNIVLDNATPVAGSASLTADGSAYLATAYEIGLGWEPRIDTMPLSTDFGNGDNYLRKKRVVKARVHVYQSLGVLFNGRPLPDDYFDLDSFDEAPEPYTGVHSIEESSNWDEGPLTQGLSQEDPLPFHILGIDLTLETS